MKRVISLLLAVCLLPMALAVPVMAADTVPALVYDLLNDVDYRLFYGADYVGTFSEPFYSISTSSTASWRWNILSNKAFSIISVAIVADAKPDRLSLYYNGAYHTFTFLYNQGQIYYYQLADSVFFDDSEIRLLATWNNGYSGIYGVDAFYGYVDHAIPVTTCDLFANMLIGDPALGYRDTLAIDSGIDIDIPVGHLWDGPYDYGLDEQLLYGEYFYKITSPILRANSVTFMVYTVGGIDVVGCRLEKSDGTTVVGLTSDVQFCGENQVVVAMDEEMYRCNVYMITADLSGHNLNGVVITLSYRVLPVESSATEEYGWGVYSSLHACAVLPEVSEVPWYAAFADWLGGILDGIKTSINGVTSAVSDWGSKLLAALTPEDPGSDQFKDDLQQAEDELQHMGDVMDSVTRPDLGQINPAVDNIVAPSDITMLSSPLAVIFDNPYILSMFVLSFTMALAGFVLYGKR